MKKKGFTLIEVIAVLSIISVLTSVFMIKFNVVGKFEEKNEIKSLLSDLDYCKQKSRVTGCNYYVVFKKNSYVIKRDLRKGEEKDNKVKFVEFNKLTMSLLDIQGVVEFKSTGSVSSGVTYLIEGQEENYKLIIGASGARIRIE